MFMAAKRAVMWCQGKTKKLQPPSPSGAAATSSGSLGMLLESTNEHIQALDALMLPVDWALENLVSSISYRTS